MYGKPFNPNRPFGTCQGDTRFAFEQDGQVYNALKEPVDANGNLMPLDPALIAPAPEPETPKAPAKPENPEDDIPEDEKPFNILAWAQGEPSLAKTPWDKIKAETARLVDDMTGVTGKEAARKAVLAHYGL